jgi:hypothetical protein
MSAFLTTFVSYGRGKLGKEGKLRKKEERKKRPKALYRVRELH